MKNTTRILILILTGCVTLPLLATLGFTIFHKEKVFDLKAAPPEKIISLLERTLDRHQSVFLSPEYYPAIPAQDLKGLPSLIESKKAMSDVSNFYRLHRERHFTLLVFGTFPDSIAMVTNLTDSPLWILSGVSPWGFILVPNISTTTKTPIWSPPSQEALTQEYPNATQRSEWLIATAENLISIGRMGAAEELLQSATATGKCIASLHGAQASLAAAQGRWNDALRMARQAHGEDSRNTAATEILSRALIECGHPDEGLDVARKLTDQLKNQETLFLLARAANAANSKAEEIEALRSLVGMARTQHQLLGASLTYLGQAYARNGERGEAIRSFREAVSQRELTTEQRLLLRGMIEHLSPEGLVPTKN